MKGLAERTLKVTNSGDISVAMDIVHEVERVLDHAKRSVGRLIRDAYRELDLPTDTAIDKGLLGKMMRGETFSAPAVDRVIADLIKRES